VPLGQIALALAAGRGFAFPALAWLVSRSPRWLMRVGFFARIRAEVAEIERSRTTASGGGAVAVLACCALLVFAPAEATGAVTRTGMAELEDGRRLVVEDSVSPTGEIGREFRDARAARVARVAVERGVFLPDRGLGLREGEFRDEARRVVFVFRASADGSTRRLLLERADGMREEREEPADEPMLTSAALPEWVAARRARLDAGETFLARFPITKAGKTLRVRVSGRALPDGGREYVAAPTNPLFRALGEPVVLRYDKDGMLLEQRGLIEPLGGSAERPALQSGRIAWRR
jgi:hypothetical protein